MLNSRIYQIIIGVLVLLILTILLLPDKETLVPEIIEPEIEKQTATTSQKIIGLSVEGREIESYQFGTGGIDILLVGGIHGGYEQNTVQLAEQMVTAFTAGEIAVPETVTVHIIPNLNPDGYAKALDPVTNFTDAAKRFNSNGVDLNRNFDCRWAPESSWRGAVVDAGEYPFSEPEAIALRDYVISIEPTAAVFWHSKANNVYGSECGNSVSESTLELAGTYATAGNYGLVPVFDAYVVTGAAEDWLASLGIPAITVELETREDSEYIRNKAGVEAILKLY